MRPPDDSAKVSVIVPCLNEEGNIAGLVERISTALSELNFEIILIDDGSTDKTIEVAERIRSEKNYIKILTLIKNLNLYSQIKMVNI
jgi:dolichol-phosphate mannosyltransferase